MSDGLGPVMPKQTPENDTFMDDLGTVRVIHVCPFICGWGALSDIKLCIFHEV